MAATPVAAAADPRMSRVDERRRPSRIVRAAAGYFGVVFAAGFVFGTVRTLGLTPRIGPRAAELLETPLMLAVVVVAARWRVRRSGIGGGGARLAMGTLGVAMLLGAEVGLVRLIGEGSVRAWLLERDPLLAATFWGSMLVMATAPVWAARGGRRGAGRSSAC
jgi:hypothetical protein